MALSVDFSKTCKGYKHLRTELWPVMGKYKAEAKAYRCFAPGPYQGRHMGTKRLEPYVPAWCPKSEEKA